MLIQENVLNKNDCVLDNFKLINKEEIISFLNKHTGFMEFIEKVYVLIRKYFPKYSYALLYVIDPQIKNYDHLMLFINGDEKVHAEDRLKLKDLEKEIRKLKISNSSLKNLLLVDVWYYEF